MTDNQAWLYRKRLLKTAAENPRVKLLGTLKPDGCKVYLVDGAKVRNGFSIDFSLGGHHRVGEGYVHIPEDEIWVEQTGPTQDLADNLIHEIVERSFMKFGGVKDYEKAHDIANSVETLIRNLVSGEKAKFK